ncbi:MAG TPA: hypothetical protein VKR06_40835 [Ktedonosporobacter sp.]|nr:hypothetical protein [Ktedonosporobacter sp.]
MTLTLYKLHATLNTLYLIALFALLMMTHPAVKLLIALFAILMTAHPIVHVLADEIVPVR